MLRNYLKVAWRNIIKHPFYSLVNIVGLSAGIAFTLLIGAYVWMELSVNGSVRNADRQYIITSKWNQANGGVELATIGPIAKELKENYPQLVENYYRFDGITSTVSKGEKSFREGLQVGDSTLLNMYGFELLQGNPNQVFDGPYSLVITEEAARKYFGRNEVLGETLTIENFSGSRHDFMITGVLKTIQRNMATHLVDGFSNDFFVSDKNLSFFGRNMNWDNYSIASFIELKKGVKVSDLKQPIADLMRKHAPAGVADVLEPIPVQLSDYYLNTNNGVLRKMLYALSAIALFILGMAVINFVNMSVSRAGARMREIGVRKVMGGLKRQLILQFLVESVLLVFLSMLFALLVYLVTKDLFGSILGKELPALSAFPLYFLSFPILLVLLTGLLAGIYPAFILSSLKSVDSLKGKLNTVKEKVWLRKSLVAIQFGTATIVLVGAIIISRQVNLFFSKDLGYDKDFIVSAQVPRNWTAEGVRKMQTIQREFSGMPDVQQVTLSYEVPNGMNSGSVGLYPAAADSTTAVNMQLLYTDEYYAATYEIPMAAGEFFGPAGRMTDSSRLVINERAVKAMGYSSAQEAINQQVKFPGSGTIFTIAGVTKDFHFGSMQAEVLPLTFIHVGVSNTFRYLSFKLKAGEMGSRIATLQKKWASLLPGAPFEYQWMDETLAKLYKSEIQLKKASVLATALSLMIALLGVVGLVSLSVQKRTKEIGIRKVLGASIRSIIILFLREFLLVILLAGLIACPVAWLLMNGWLSDYANRVAIDAGPFIIAIAGLGLATSLLIFGQTIRAGSANPVHSLRAD